MEANFWTAVLASLVVKQESKMAAPFWSAMLAALVQVASLTFHREGNLQQKALMQLVVSGIAGILPNYTPLNDSASRELMVGLVRLVAGFGLEQRNLFQHSLDAVLNDAAGQLLYYSLLAVQRGGTVPIGVGVGNTTGTNVPMSNGNLPQPRPGDAPSGNNVSPVYINGTTTPSTSPRYFNPWAG